MDELEEDLRGMVGSFVVVCKRKDLKAHIDKSRVNVSGGNKGSVSAVIVDRKSLDHD